MGSEPYGVIVRKAMGSEPCRIIIQKAKRCGIIAEGHKLRTLWQLHSEKAMHGSEPFWSIIQKAMVSEPL